VEVVQGRCHGDEEVAVKTRWSVNITPAERAARVLVGLVGAIGALVLLAGSPSPVTGALEVLLLAGLDLLVTGAVGHCPLYRRLGYLPRSLRRTT